MNVVLLHGINDTDPDGNWMTRLNRGFVQAGFEPLTVDDIIAQKYGDLLDGVEPDREWPPETYKVRDDRIARRDFERRQARVQRILSRSPGSGSGTRLSGESYRVAEPFPRPVHLRDTNAADGRGK